jgi:hypothetical protein
VEDFVEVQEVLDEKNKKYHCLDAIELKAIKQL